MDSKLMEILPVGGVGQIGSNVTQVITKNSCILIDFGILFPAESFFGINYLVADINTIKEPTDIVFTHAHEDHIGAVVQLLKMFPLITFWASPFSARLIEEKLKYSGIKKKINYYSENSIMDFGDFNIHPIHVNHSIPETFGLFIEDKQKRFSTFFASDFKVDELNPYEKPFNFEKLSTLSKDIKKRIAFIDSTNIASSKLKTPSEGELIPSFEKIFNEKHERIFITLFASNVHRMRTIVDVAKKNGFTIFASGRSMKKYIAIAQETGHLTKDVKIIEEYKNLTQKNKLVVLVAGCQGDFRSAFRRIGLGEDKNFKIQANDAFVYSSKAIPGNEKGINTVLNEIYTTGAKVYMDNDLPIHASGHPGKKDLEIFYNQYNPTDVVPIHGETSFLYLHKKFIDEMYPQMQTHLLKNFTSLVINKDLSISTNETSPNKPIIIHGKGIELPREVVSSRRKLATLGCIFASFSQKSGEISITHIGLPSEIINLGINDLKDSLKVIYNQHNKKPSLIEEARIYIRNFFNSDLGYKPLAIVHLV